MQNVLETLIQQLEYTNKSIIAIHQEIEEYYDVKHYIIDNLPTTPTFMKNIICKEGKKTDATIIDASITM